MTRPRPRPIVPPGPPRAGFTQVELLVVIVVMTLLIALLLPAINGAVRTARNTAAQANLTQLANALAAFKAKHGEYPPSRVLLWEDGWFRTGDTTVMPGVAGQTDLTAGQLAQRSLQHMRKFFPKATFSTSGAVWTNLNQWYDFNGDGQFGGLNPTSGAYEPSRPILLQGHQCLVFFLGGLPQQTDEGYSMTGFAKNPSNPFTPAVLPAVATSSTFFSQNREAPTFEFAANRLLSAAPGEFPGYMDSLGNTLGGGQINFIAYFSAYGNNAYDPNDVNFAEVDEMGATILNRFKVRFPVSGANGMANSPAPNPYTTGPTWAATAAELTRLSVAYVNPQTYQLISSGSDGLYGPGGTFKANTGADALPFDAAATTPAASANIRQRERDNLTNFHGGTLD
ncbi:hypothetical protein [Paludisphaera sp.]|uniref:type II secretion system protein n=1 Tax=Paludisphaera sp. TaxID=2017432 RepID=UPI00301E32CD